MIEVEEVDPGTPCEHHHTFSESIICSCGNLHRRKLVCMNCGHEKDAPIPPGEECTCGCVDQCGWGKE